MRVLALVTDAYGGRGGIAQYNRDFFTALSGFSECAGVTVVPRVVFDAGEPVPAKIELVAGAARGPAQYLAALWKALHSAPPFDLIVCAHINLLPIAWLCRRRLPAAPLVLIVYGIDAWKRRKRLLNNRLFPGVDAVISISRETLGRFRAWSQYPERNAHILPNAIHLENYGPAAKPSYLLDRYRLHGKRIMLTMGRLAGVERYKGFDEVLETLPELLKTHPDVCYLIAGDGDDRDRLVAKARALGVADHVVFCGYVREAEKADHYRVADVFVMPGRCEGFGFVYLEAMACGIPVVGSKLDGSREALRDGMLGTLVNPDDPAELRAGILEALDKPRTVPSGLDYFAYPRFVERLKNIVVDIVGNKQGQT